MEGTSTRRSIANRTDSRKNHQIRFIISSQGRTVSDLKTLKAGESADLEHGDRLIIISDKNTNYKIRWEDGALLGAEQVNNNHPKFPESTVATYHLATASVEEDLHQMQLSGTARDADNPDPVIIIVEPEKPEP
jgi:hypothetical protein